jgi:hypothetical protein
LSKAKANNGTTVLGRSYLCTRQLRHETIVAALRNLRREKQGMESEQLEISGVQSTQLSAIYCFGGPSL